MIKPAGAIQVESEENKSYENERDLAERKTKERKVN